MTYKDLAEIMFPDVTKTIDDYESMYPKRELKEGARVTRFAPSPTGYMHIGNLYSALVDYINAKNTDGLFFLRNEDTDGERTVEGAVEAIMNLLTYYGLNPDEYEYNGEVHGNYGPYIQSKRKDIYRCFAKHLVEIGRAYPCFCKKEETDKVVEYQRENGLRTGYYGRYAKCRNISVEDAYNRIKNGEEYVVKFKSSGNFDKKFKFDDLVLGCVELPENDQDVPIIKSSNGLPTYHFAHVVDDHLMRTTHVIRGNEWLPSTPLHKDLFEAFGFKMPKYIHNPLLLKKDGDIVRKISKRKDPEFFAKYYEEIGYPKEAVIEALMTIINSNFEEWRNSHPDLDFTKFTFSPKKMSSSGAFFDLDKLNNISKNIISKKKASVVFEELLNWALVYDKDFANLISNYKEYTTAILNIEREQKKPRKDYQYYSEIKEKVWYMFDELYETHEKNYEYQTINDLDEINTIVSTYLNEYYDDNDDQETWFNKIKDVCERFGYAREVKEYKANPDSYKGHVGDVSTAIRVRITTKSQTPDLYQIMKLLGKDRMLNRIK